MTAALLILLLGAGGLAAWLAGRRAPGAARWAAVITLAGGLAWLTRVWTGPLPAPVAGWAAAAPDAAWIERLSVPWIPRFGISISLGLDGLSLVLVTLTLALGLVAVAASWRDVSRRVGFFHLNLLWTLAGAVGVFTALDIFLFFLFWEAMLVPMFFVIALWGHGDSRRAALKFFLFTQGSGLLLLLGILTLALAHGGLTGELSFDWFALRAVSGRIDPDLAFWAMLGFFLAFAVKLPAVPLHTWLADAHSQAPTGGSVILAGVLLKTGAYGLLRFLVPLFPEASQAFAPVALWLGAAGVLYGAVLAFAQRDLKRLIAYSSISHMGLVLLGVFAWTPAALQGALVQMVAHGISAAALFTVAGALRERVGGLDSGDLGGLWARVPRLSALGLLFAVATLGLPGFGNFVGEILVLVGAFPDHPVPTLVAVAGVITAAVYGLALVQRAFHGPPHPRRDLHDQGLREGLTLGVLALALAAIGLHPQPLLDAAAPALAALAAGVAP